MQYRPAKIIIALCLCLILCGCGGGAPGTSSASVDAATEAPAAKTEAPDTPGSETETARQGAGSAPQDTPEGPDADNPTAPPTAEAPDDPRPMFPAKATAPEGGLRVIGADLCDDKGNPIQLRGVSTHGIQWYPEYINQELFDELKNTWNCNVVRLAMYTIETFGYCTDGDKDALKETIDKGVECATNAGMYAIIDWHVMREGDPMLYADESIAFFDEMSEKYADNPHVIYELCNEPNGRVGQKAISEYARMVIPVIRKNSPDSVIIVGTPMYSGAILEPLKDPLSEYDNIMYSLHFYARSHRESRLAEMKAAYKQGIPIIVTEFGATANSGAGDIDREWGDIWLDALDELGISYICWNLSNKNEDSALIKTDCNKTSGFTPDDLKDQGVWYFERLAK